MSKESLYDASDEVAKLIETGHVYEDIHDMLCRDYPTIPAIVAIVDSFEKITV